MMINTNSTFHSGFGAGGSRQQPASRHSEQRQEGGRVNLSTSVANLVLSSEAAGELLASSRGTLGELLKQILSRS